MPIVLEQIRLLFWDLLVTCVIFGAHSYESDTSLVLGTISSGQSLKKKKSRHHVIVSSGWWARRRVVSRGGAVARGDDRRIAHSAG